MQTTQQTDAISVRRQEPTHSLNERVQIALESGTFGEFSRQYVDGFSQPVDRIREKSALWHAVQTVSYGNRDAQGVIHGIETGQMLTQVQTEYEPMFKPSSYKACNGF